MRTNDVSIEEALDLKWVLILYNEYNIKLRESRTIKSKMKFQIWVEFPEFVDLPTIPQYL